MLIDLYRMMITSILYYKMDKKDIESIRFEVNPYNVCVANRMVSGKQHAVTWHMDDVKTSRDVKLGFFQPRFLQVFRRNLNILNGLKKVFLGFPIFFSPGR